jgi:hypothetical protein
MKLQPILATILLALSGTGTAAQTTAADEAMRRPTFGLFAGGWDRSAAATVASFEAALGKPVVLINQFNGENGAWTGSGSIASNAGWLLSQPGRAVAAPPRRLVYALHLGINPPRPNKTGLTKAQWDKRGFGEIVAGKHDDAYRAVGRALLRAGFRDAIIRLGQEGNGDFFPGCACNDPAGFAAAWNRVAALLLAIPGNRFTVGLDFSNDRPVAKYTVGIDWSLVGFINLDVYDETWDAASQTTPQKRWSYLRGHGIDETLALAREKAKPVAFFEWATGRAGPIGGADNPYFVARMAELIHDPANQVLGHAYWQSKAGYAGTIGPAVNPNAWAEFKRRFGG